MGATLAGAFAPVVRYEASKAASRYGATLAVGRVVPTLRGARLRDVDVALEEVPSVRIHLDEVEVTYGSGGRSVALRGGSVAALGARDVVLRQAEAWRSHHVATDGGGSGQGGSRGELDLTGLRVSWANSLENPTETLSASDLRVSRAEGRVAISAGEAKVSVSGTSFSVKDGRIELVRRDGAYRVGVLSAAGVEAELVVPTAKPAPADGPTLNLDPPLPPVAPPPAASAASRAAPPGGRRRAGRSSASRSGNGETTSSPGAVSVREIPRTPPPPPAKASPGSGGTASDSGRGAASRAAMLDVARLVDRALEPGAKVRLEGLRARLHRGEDYLNLGPGILQVSRVEGRLLVELAPELRPAVPAPAAPAQPPATLREEALTFRLSLPLGEASGEISADVDGGPIWLSSLGVHEGDFGLFDVGKASLSTHSHLVLSADGRTLRVDGDAKLHALSLKSAALSDEPVAGLELAVRLKGDLDLDGSRARVAEGEVDLGALRVVAQGEYERVADAHHLHGTFDLPITACQSMLDSTPKGLVPKLQGMRLAGSYALRGRADIDTSHLDRGFVLDWDAANTCRVVEAPEAVSVERFRKPFRRTAYDPEGRPVSIETGPGTPDWVPRSAISKFMEVAVLTTEDGGFHRHHGFDREAIKNSLRENLRRRRFVRGASTISMQLAKNLYLDRGKNLSRKLQEAVLTMYLEQELTKDQLLELYLNVVEFGPMVYGIGPAARYYFSTGARDISLGQALYISSIMPNPKVQHFGAGGAVSDAWMNYLRKLMKIARDRDNLTEEELEEGLRETVVRGSPTPQRSARPNTVPEPELPPDAADAWSQ